MCIYTYKIFKYTQRKSGKKKKKQTNKQKFSQPSHLKLEDRPPDLTTEMLLRNIEEEELAV